jgi:outer membrane protein OmpA-like peptidoglycan-associated protein
VVETFAYGIGQSRMRFSLAADAPINVHDVGVEPFLEYHADVAVTDGDQTLARALTNMVSDDRLNNRALQYLTLGLRVRPIGGLVLDAALDVGLQSPGFRFGPPVPGWNLVFGAAYDYDPVTQTARTKVVTKTVTREVRRGPVTGKIRGIVRDAATKQPIAGATVRYTNLRVTPQLTAEDGSFVSYGFFPGPVELEVSRDDYNAAQVKTSAYPDSETPVEVLLTAKPPAAGQVRAHVTDSNGKPISLATVRFTSPSGAIVDADVESPGNFVARLPPGEYTVDFVADGFLAKQRQVTVNGGQVQSIDVSLTKKPARTRVQLGKGEIKVKGTVHFGTNNAVIRPDGEQLLDEVADVIIRHPEIHKIRVEGHTDNRGNAQHNLTLSKQRAQAVVDYLIKQGVDPSRLTAEGYGSTQPLVPNLTPANRARNRRVAFKIVEEGPTP